jgi:hypothetical protein
VIGSTTACVASLVPQAGAVIGLNMGDSGMLLLRKSKVPSDRLYEVGIFSHATSDVLSYKRGRAVA